MTSINKDIPGFHRGLENMPGEFDYSPHDIEGDIPEDINGTFYRNGPGKLTLGSGKMGHWFDGDGMVCAFHFEKGKLHFRNRFVRTPKFIAESLSNRIEFRGFGTQRKGGLKANFLRIPANPANTSIALHGGKLLALYEGGR
ncbi:MAG: carotenoid oxygenase family protein, partial [Pseudomonadales bacterium]|nr:carotenoid oxygenase family protein [Pseudomonadales bacterium]